jgi:hypothetical protein
VTVVWDVLTDLPEYEGPAQLRFFAGDGKRNDSRSDPADSDWFKVDNDAPPLAFLEGESFASNPDERLGIPVPFRLVDAEGGPIDVLLQWRAGSDSFPELPTTAEALRDDLGDQATRARLHICTEKKIPYRGYVNVPADADQDHIRLREISTSASLLLASGGVAGRSLDILRSEIPITSLTSTWTQSTPLANPVAVLPIEDSVTALVLDSSSSSGAPGWRIREIDLGTGGVIKEIQSVQGAGVPITMTRDQPGSSLLVADRVAASWQIWRVPIRLTGTISRVVDGGAHPGELRDLVAINYDAGVATVGSELVEFRLDTGDIVTLLQGLHTPWGLARDPLQEHGVYLSEREGPSGAGRIMALDLNTLNYRPVPQNGLGLPHPSAIALEHHGARLLAVTDDDAFPGQELRVMDLAGGDDGRAFALIEEGLPADVGRLASGEANLHLLALPGEDDILGGGGIQQRRLMRTFDTATLEATLDQPFEPILVGPQTWQILDRATNNRSGTGAAAIDVRDMFVWDTNDVPQGGSIAVRLVTMDEDMGISEELGASRKIRCASDEDPCTISATTGGERIEIVDLNGDGQPDVMAGDTVFFQTGPCEFSPQPMPTGAVADFDEDGDLDVAAGVLYEQTAPGVFVPCTGANVPSGIAADFNNDGHVDLESGGVDITIVFNKGRGTLCDRFLNPETCQVHVVDDQFCQNFCETGGVAVADVDQDGLCDIVWSVTNFGQGAPFYYVGILYNRDDCNFDNSYYLWGPDGIIADVAVGDVNGDGRADIAWGSTNEGPNHGQISVAVQSSQRVGNNQLPTFDVVNLFDFLGEGTRILDLDSNGLSDILSAGSAFFQNDPSQSPLALQADLGIPPSVQSADMNGNGGLDIVSYALTGIRLRLTPRAAPDMFSSTPDRRLLFGAQPTGTSYVGVGDCDGDGDLDLIWSRAIVDPVESQLVLEMAAYLQNGPRGLPDDADFTIRVHGPGGSGTLAAAHVVDVNGDGLLDLVSSDTANCALTVYYQDPASVGSFSQSISLLPSNCPDVTGCPGKVTSGYLDGSNVDLVTNIGDSVVVFYQESLNPPIFVCQAYTDDQIVGLVDLVTADVDGDGYVDIVTVDRDSNKCVILYGSGHRSFEAGTALQDGVVQPSGVNVADVDGDGALDIVLASDGNQLALVFYQGAPRSFSKENDLAMTGPVTVGDVDQDGDVDVIAGSLFLQTSPRKFRQGTFPATGGVLADFDGDSELDLLGIGESGGAPTVDIFYGGH